MSGQWEVVGKKKDKGNTKIINNKSSKKENFKDVRKNVLNDFNLDDVLPKSQVKNLYNNEKNKDGKKAPEKSKTESNNGVKKQPKKADKPQTQEVTKPKPPKSIESALNSINAEEFKNIFEESRKMYPDGPIIWLKELSKFLSQKVPIDVQDPVFSTKPSGYPLNMVPSAVKHVMETSVKEAGKSNTQVFFDISLTSMATDMSKNLPSLGHKFYLQYIALSDPSVVIEGLKKYTDLLNSYQNRPNIGLSILWILGQSGLKDFHSGFKVFEDIMMPLIEMKNYSKFIFKYLVDIINHNNNKTNVGITVEQYLTVLDVAFSNKKNFPNELKKDLTSACIILKSQLFVKSDKNKYHNVVEILIKKLSSNSNKSYQNCLCDTIIECFLKDSSSLRAWSTIYSKNLASSAVVLNYICEIWKSFQAKLNKKIFSELLNTYRITNEDLLQKKRKEDGLNEAIAAVKKVSEKMVLKKKSGFPFKTFSFLILIAIGSIVYLDVKQHGSWNDCRTRKALKDSGVCEYTSKALNRTKEGILWVDARVEQSFPGVHKKVADFSEPYVQLSKDLSLVGYNAFLNVRNMVVEKYPVIRQSIEDYAPGVIEASQRSVTNIWTTSVLYFNRSVDYLKKEVFVGQLSPENMQKVVLEALNTTQQKASEYYHWLYEKVQTTIK